MAFNTQYSQRPGSPRRLLLAGKSAVVERLIGEEQDENQANVVQDGVDPVSPAPIETPNHKGSHERTEVWRSDDEAGPDVDLPW
jgi:GTPase SAR1 family protein